jgi:hypothetical protein
MCASQNLSGLFAKEAGKKFVPGVPFASNDCR